jgi:uncharacterized membrane protein
MNSVKETQRWEKENHRAYKKRCWQKKTLAQKLATIWLNTIGWAILLTVASALIGIFVFFELDKKIPIAGKITAIVALLVLGISWWALEQD